MEAEHNLPGMEAVLRTHHGSFAKLKRQITSVQSARAEASKAAALVRRQQSGNAALACQAISTPPQSAGEAHGLLPRSQNPVRARQLGLLGRASRALALLLHACLHSRHVL